MYFLKISALVLFFALAACSELSALELSFNNESIKETALFLKGNDASIRGDYQTATSIFRDLLKLQPNDNYLKRNLSIELIRNGELKEAETMLEAILNGPDNPDESIKLILAGVFDARGKPEQAQTLYQDIIQTSANIETACLYLAKSFLREKKYNKNYAVFSKCERKYIADPAYAFYRGEIESGRGHALQAIKYFKKSVSMNPSYLQSVLALGDFYETKEDLRSALKTYKDFLTIAGNSTNLAVLSRIVTLLFSMEKNTAVIPYAEKLCSIDKSDLNLKVHLGLLYSDSGRYIEAIELFEEVLSIVPDSEKVIYYLGALNQQINHSQEAIKYFKRIPESSAFYGNAKKKIENILGVQTKQWASLLKEFNKLDNRK
ncbi:MAG: tetratricopeptide repeat protein [Bacteriovorax sp.]|nr:tetratricopeptide repeat protein [Bacteriovorax sp.]